jgi:kinesin family protein 4/21/27
MQKKWEKIESSVNAIIIKKQTIGLIEREMERFLEQREKISRKLNRLEKRLAKAVSLENSKDSSSLTSSNLTNTISNSTSSDMADSVYVKSPSNLKIDELKDQVDIMKSNIDYLQDQIGECQSNIIQLEEAKDGSDYGVEKLINTINTFEEAKFILKKFFMLALNKGMFLK